MLLIMKLLENKHVISGKIKLTSLRIIITVHMIIVHLLQVQRQLQTLIIITLNIQFINNFHVNYVF